MNFSFGNSALLWGSLLFVVPLIIHLLNRRRFKVIRWAAQDFLLQAYRQTRRRLTFESLLLLLVRCLLILLLALALARPFVPRSNLLSIFSPSQRNVVLVIDTSYSMGRTSLAGDTPLVRAKAQARQLLESLAEDRGDEVALVTLSDPPLVVQHRTSKIEAVRGALDRLECDATGADLLRTLDLINETILAPSERAHEVYLITDMQRRTFEPEVDGAPAEESAEATPATAWRRAAAANATFLVVDVGDDAASRNLAVERLEVDPQNVVKGEVVTLTATVRNHGTRPQTGLAGRFVLDGRREDARRVTFDVEAGSIVSVECPVSLAAAESTSVEFALDGDELAIDDARYLAFPVDEAVPVLLVDGDYAAGDLRETAVLADVLDPSGDPETGMPAPSGKPGSVFRVRTIDDRRFNLRGEDPADYQLIVLANVPRLDAEMATRLDEAVRAGRGLMVFLGDRVDAASWNDRLYRSDGSGLLPARLLEIRGDVDLKADTGFQPIADDFDHPILKLFDLPGLREELTTTQRIRRFFRSDVTPKDVATSVLLRVMDDPRDPSPLVLEKPAGRGRVILWTTTADDAWSSLPRNVFAFLPLIQETAAYLTLSDLSSFNLGVRERIRRKVRTIPSEVVVVTPRGERRPIDDVSTEREYGEYVLPPFDGTREPGIYDLEMSYPLAGAGRDAGRRVVEHYAVNVDVREGNLARVEEAAFATLYPGVPIRFDREIDTSSARVADRREGELWRALLWTLVVLLAAEMTMAWWFGRR